MSNSDNLRNEAINVLSVMDELATEVSGMDNDIKEMIHEYSRISIADTDIFLDSFDISTDENRESASYIDLLKTYEGLYQEHQDLVKETERKDEKLQHAKETVEELGDKLRKMERLLQDEIKLSDEDKEFAVRERKELNKKVQDLEHDIVKKKGEIIQEQELKEKVIKEKEVKERETNEKDKKIEDLLKENQRLEKMLKEKEGELENEGRKGKENEKLEHEKAEQREQIIELEGKIEKLYIR